MRSEIVEQGSRRTIRTVETIERQEKTFLVGNLQAGTFDACPLCGSKLPAATGDQTRPQLHD